MSGGPLLTAIERNGIVLWQLGGVIKQGNASLEIILASRADFILRDGQLRK